MKSQCQYGQIYNFLLYSQLYFKGYKSFVWTCSFWAKNISNFASQDIKLYNQYCHSEHWLFFLCRWRRGIMETVSFLGWRSKASYQSPSVWNFNEPRSKLMSSEKRWWEEFNWFTNYSGIRSGHVHLSSFYHHFIQFFSQLYLVYNHK